MGALPGMTNRCLMLLWMWFSSPLTLSALFPASSTRPYLSSLSFHSSLCFCLSLPAGAVPDHGSGDYDPLFTAGRLLCLCFAGNRLLCLHHSGGAFCTQGALTCYWHLLETAARDEGCTRIVVKSKVKCAQLRKFSMYCMVRENDRLHVVALHFKNHQALMLGLTGTSNKKT